MSFDADLRSNTTFKEISGNCSEKEQQGFTF